ncbi:MAG: malto-oligosyltrehalose synthase [Micropruina sp.]|uniref:malto-oligosyltrehalose synthase n=1 Tax=Micropruina sp. TaxID=2737536 RepID=UPI0039E46102
MEPTARPFTATYRLQLHSGFTFDDAAAIVPHLAALGVSHVYLAPILTAVPGSKHGYDVLDHTAVNPELGGRDALERLAARCHAHDLGIVVDIVPNHMALVEGEWRNAPLWDVLRHGRKSSFAHWFDVDWDHLDGRFGLPILAAPPADTSAELRLDIGRPDEGPASGTPVLRYHEHVLPLRPDGPETSDLATLLDAQHWRLTPFAEAAETLNYRRFFDVDQLVAIRVEEPDVFDASHALLLELHHAGVIDGFRIDHPDGLADPAGYLARLVARCRPGTPIWVEKILEGDERLPDWACHGTTGYDAAAAIDAALIDPAGMDAVSASWAVTGGEPELDACLEASKRQVLAQLLQPELNRLQRTAVAALPGIDPARLRAALSELLVQLRVYRAYVTPGTLPEPALTAPLRAALQRVRADRPDLADAAAALIGVLTQPETAPGDSDAARDLCVRFQQTTGPVMAKGIEDTACYRWHRLVALNEVGGDPSSGDHPDVEPLHAWAEHQADRWPSGMTTLSTHDTKRSEDVRARLIALAGDAAGWTHLANLAAGEAQRHGVDAPTGHLVWQTVAGTPGITPERLDAYLTKALREGKQRTGWLQPDADYEKRVLALGRAMLAGGPVGEAIAQVAQANADAIRCVTLVQKLLQLTLPGVPDTYQGAEMLNLTLVDPDNRAGIDFAGHAARLAALDAGIVTEPDLDDEILLITSRTLRLRRKRPADFSAGYRRLELGDGLLGFARGADVLVAVRRLPRTPLPASVPLPEGSWRDAFTGAVHRDGTASLFDALPVALLVREG